MHRFLIAALALLAAAATPAHAQSFYDGTFDEAIPTLETFAGHASGEEITSPETAAAYMRALAQAAPERMQLFQYATSWEGRPLTYAVITSAANMARIDAIKADMTTLASGVAPAQAEALISRTLPVTWLTYGVHGNEISSTDAALALAYHLLASEGDETVDTILANSVVVIDPSQNPDGRARFINSYYQQLGLAPSGNRATAGHDEPWPGGRVNHYLFDLNRDWFALTQPESRGKIAAVREWHPVVVVDVHEMGGDESYFFPPAADPFNPYLTETQRERQNLLGRNNGAALDALGQPYFTREVFDAFYPGYGDSWPMMNGAVGMTFEQASARGLVWERNNGEVLTYAMSVRNHFATTLATATTVARNANQFLSDYASFRRAGVQGASGSSHYVIDLAQKRWNALSAGSRLVSQGIAVRLVEGPASACGRSYPQGYLAVAQAQPAAPLIRNLLEEHIDLPPEFIAAQENRRDNDLPHELYDTTAWSVTLMSGLSVSECNSAAAGTPIVEGAGIAAKAESAGAFGLAVPWTDSGQVQLVAKALGEGLKGRSTDTAFTVEGRTFPRGTVVFTLADNGGSLDALEALALQVGAETVALDSGWTDSGPNLGSDSFVVLDAPKIAILWDNGVSNLSAGATRYVIERRFGLPVAPVRTHSVAYADLTDFDVIIAPNGNLSGSLGAGGRAALADFVKRGGVLVAYGNAMGSFASGDDALFATKAETALGTEPGKGGEDGPMAAGSAIASDAAYAQTIADQNASPDILPGALLNTEIDVENFLSAGYDSMTPVVVADGSLILTPLSRGDGINVVRFANASDLVASGYVWNENRQQMAYKPYMMAQPNGDGLAIGFVHDPSVRGFLDGLDMLLANAVMVAPARMR